MHIHNRQKIKDKVTCSRLHFRASRYKHVHCNQAFNQSEEQHEKVHSVQYRCRLSTGVGPLPQKTTLDEHKYNVITSLSCNVLGFCPFEDK